MDHQAIDVKKTLDGKQLICKNFFYVIGIFFNIVKFGVMLLEKKIGRKEKKEGNKEKNRGKFSL